MQDSHHHLQQQHPSLKNQSQKGMQANEKGFEETFLTRTQSDTASPSFSRSLACLYPRSSRQTHAPATAHQCTTVHRRSGHHHQPHLFLSQSLSHYSASLSLSEGYWVGKGYVQRVNELNRRVAELELLRSPYKLNMYTNLFYDHRSPSYRSACHRS
ncbi:uncharacterized protein LOC130730635 isoform X2 [Lotus japonicus]|uniref:uncharacterized protein LOC130730635 isoform X2 n=1 Tax=Lotus japonicus TaxID=34305 RepID=UPI002586EA56|nr:uncharacterized protein LOC130730635 isoform X2 [Lotus japonicus]